MLAAAALRYFQAFAFPHQITMRQDRTRMLMHPLHPSYILLSRTSSSGPRLTIGCGEVEVSRPIVVILVPPLTISHGFGRHHHFIGPRQDHARITILTDTLLWHTLQNTGTIIASFEASQDYSLERAHHHLTSSCDHSRRMTCSSAHLEVLSVRGIKSELAVVVGASHHWLRPRPTVVHHTIPSLWTERATTYKG
jgi:hypothetical protein